MSRHEDIDGIDGPFNRAMKRAMRDDDKAKLATRAASAPRGNTGPYPPWSWDIEPWPWHDMDGVRYCDEHGVYQCRFCESAYLIAAYRDCSTTIRALRERVAKVDRLLVAARRVDDAWSAVEPMCGTAFCSIPALLGLHAALDDLRDQRPVEERAS